MVERSPAQHLGKYEILEELGRGGFATVYRARDLTLEREVALKVLHPQLLTNPSFVERFQREARTLAGLRHPHIVTIYEVGEVAGQLFIAMELARGPSLAQALADRERFSWQETLEMLKPVCDALDYAHEQGVTHRDLKPANILLDEERGPLLTDFGFARLMASHSASLSLSGGVVGTPSYIAPEVWEADAVGPAVDIYALGCIVHEMLTGQALFPGNTPMQVMRAHDKGPRFPTEWPEGVPGGITNVLRKALAREPQARYPGAGALWYGLNDMAAATQAAQEDAERAALAAQWKAETETAMATGEWGAARMAVGRWLAVAPDDARGRAAQAKVERQLAQAGEPSGPELTAASRGLPSRLWVLGGVAAVVLVAVMAAVVLVTSPTGRGGGTGGLAEGKAITLEDGAQLTIPPEGIQGNTKIKFAIVSRSSFLEGSAGKDLLLGAENIPPWLVMKSPYHRIQFRGQEPPTRVLVRLPIPGDADPLYTLDLYAWNGEVWEWLPHVIPPGDDFIESSLDYLPQSVVVMQTKPLQPSVSAELAQAAVLPAEAQGTVVEINPQGLYLDSDGGIRGDPGMLLQPDATATYIVMPTLRNWEEGSAARSDLIDNLLMDEDARREHVQRIVELVVRNAYPGIDIDYRDINPNLRDDYTRFIAELAQALHQNGKQLSVRLELPVQVAADRWETGVYDWVSIGAAADMVKIPVLEDLRAYDPGGQMDVMLTWAVGQVNRYKIQLIISTRSVERSQDGTRRTLPYTEALAPFFQVMVEGGGTVVNPGQQVTFTLAGLEPSTDIQFDAASGTYWFAYIDPSGQQRTVWVESAASIARKLQYVAEYNLRGVAVQNLLGEENDARIWEVIRQFRNLVIPSVESQFIVVWTVKSGEGGILVQDETTLTDSVYSWTAPEEGGEYLIAAAISLDGSTTGTELGSVSVLVATPTPIPPDTSTPVPPTDTPPDCPNPGTRISEPGSGAIVSGVIQIVGSATISDFGYYKFEFRGNGFSDWTFIQRFEEPIIGGILGAWDTDSITSGEYEFRLVVVDQTGMYPPPCTLRLSVQHE